MSVPFTPQVSVLLSGALGGALLPVGESPPLSQHRVRDPYDRYEWSASLPDRAPAAATLRLSFSSALQATLASTIDLDGSAAANASSVTIPLSSVEVVSATGEDHAFFALECYEDPAEDAEWLLQGHELDTAAVCTKDEGVLSAPLWESAHPTAAPEPRETHVNSSTATPTAVSSESAGSSGDEEDVSLAVSPDVSFEEEALHRRMAAFRAEIDHMYLEVEKDSNPYVSLHHSPLSAPPPLNSPHADARRPTMDTASSSVSTDSRTTVDIPGGHRKGQRDRNHATYTHPTAADREPPGSHERAAFLRYTSTSQQHALAERARNICRRLISSGTIGTRAAPHNRQQKATQELQQRSSTAKQVSLVQNNKRLHTATTPAAPITAPHQSSSNLAARRSSDNTEIPVYRSPSSTVSTMTATELVSRDEHDDSSLSPVLWKEPVAWVPVQHEQRPPIPSTMQRHNESGTPISRSVNLFRVQVRVTPTPTGTP